MKNLPPWWRLLAAALSAVLAAGVLIVVTTTDDPGPGQPHHTVTVRLGGAAEAATSSPAQMRVPATAVAQAATPTAAAHAADARDETPAGVPAAEVEKGREQQDRLAADDQLPVVAPDAAPSQAGCRSRFISSYSSRRGVAPRIIVLHYTVSPNVTGWSDVDGVTGFFARPATQASSNYVIDGEGHCNYIVRDVDKAWAQATFNPVALSIEVVNTGHEPQYIRPAGLKTLARVVADKARLWHIPLQPGAVSGCTVTRPGVVTHQMLGLCGGGHVDISPYGNAARDQVIAAAAALTRPVTATDRATCRRINWWRAHGRPKGKAETNAVRRRRALAARHITCTAHGAARA